jgi:hypothetical protein
MKSEFSFFAQGMPVPCTRHEDSLQMGVVLERDSEHIPNFALIPVRVTVNPRDGTQSRVLAFKWDFDPQVFIACKGYQGIDHGKIRSRLIVPMDA